MSSSVKLVATRLEHANEYLVLRRYGHLLPGVDRAVTDLLSDRLRRVREEAHGTRMAHEAAGEMPA